MASRLALVLLVVSLSACRPQPESGQASGDLAADSLAAAGPEPAGGDTTGLEFEAPRLIPGVRASIQNLTERGGKVDEGTVAGYRQAAGRLVDAMLTDLNRVGVGDNGSFQAMGDSVGMLIGGGPGDAPDAAPADVMRSAELLKRLIDRYQRSMRSVEG